jgi:hypothetical protein
VSCKDVEADQYENQATDDLLFVAKNLFKPLASITPANEIAKQTSPMIMAGMSTVVWSTPKQTPTARASMLVASERTIHRDQLDNLYMGLLFVSTHTLPYHLPANNSKKDKRNPLIIRRDEPDYR